MSKQEPTEENENTITYVYIPDEDAYGIIVNHGAWASMVSYFDGGLEYIVEMENDEFIEVDEIGIGYVEEGDYL